MRELGLRNLFKNFTTTFGRQLFASILGFITVALTVRLLGPRGNGLYTMALLLPSLLGSFLSLGISSSNVYYLGSRQVSHTTVFYSNLLLGFFISWAGVISGALMIYFKGEMWFPGVPSHLLYLTLIMFPTGVLQDHLSSIFQGKQNFKVFNLLPLIHPLIMMMGLGLLFLWGYRQVYALVLFYIFSSLVSTGVALYCFLKMKAEPPGNIKAYTYKSIHFGLKSYVSNALAFINYKADLFVVNLLLGPVNTGIYVISIQLAEKLWLVSTAVSAVLYPRLSELSADEVKKAQITPLISRAILGVTLLGATLLASLGYFIIYYIFGESFLPAFQPMLILLPGIVCYASSRVLANDLASRGKPELNMYLGLVVVGINIVANFILVPTFGLSGAAAATSLSYSLDFIMRMFVYKKLSHNSIWSNIFSINDYQLLRQLLKKTV